MTEITHVFVDLDEVLADWVKPALALLGFDHAKVLRDWAKLEPRPWNVFDVVGVKPKDAWARIELAGDRFWSTLPKRPYAERLLKHCSRIGPTTVLTSPSRCPSSYAGKVKWLDYHFGKGFAYRNALIGGSKSRVSRPGALLIDDSPRHCAEWAQQGGRAILFPGVGNVLHKEAERPLDVVLPQLEECMP